MKVEAMCKIPHQKPTEGFCFSHSSPYKYVPLSILLWCLALLFRKFWVWISAQRLGTQTEAQLCKNLKIFCISYLLLHSFLCNIFFVGYPPEVRGWFVWNNLQHSSPRKCVTSGHQVHVRLLRRPSPPTWYLWSRSCSYLEKQ